MVRLDWSVCLYFFFSRVDELEQIIEHTENASKVSISFHPSMTANFVSRFVFVFYILSVMFFPFLLLRPVKKH